MKIGYLMPPTITGRRNGVVSQALAWKDGLEKLGVSVDLITPWETMPWKEYDAVHAFGIGHYLETISSLKAHGVRRIVLSPIFDSERPEYALKLLSLLDIPSVGVKTSWAMFSGALPSIDVVLARSRYEAQKLQSIFDIPDSKIALCPLPTRFQESVQGSEVLREPICSHVSILSAKTKNVLRLLEAAVKYRFPLRLAGTLNDGPVRTQIEKLMGMDADIQYLGVLSDQELRQLYRRSRVFALPSLAEGVGLVALEAAQHGADIVITERGGPKEYYGSMARTVNPDSVDEIGRAVQAYLGGATHQPQLGQQVCSRYSSQASAQLLRSIY